MRKQIAIVAGVAALGLAYSLFGTLMQRDDALPPALITEDVGEPRIAPVVVREPIIPPSAVEVEEPETLAEFDADGDDHDVGEAAELQELQLPPELPDEDPDPIVGELAALQEARAIVQGLLSEPGMDPAAREQAAELLELIDSQGQQPPPAAAQPLNEIR